MRAGYELRQYVGDEKVWVGKYKNARNLLHWHYDCELIYVNEGNITIFVGGAYYQMETGQSAFIGPGEVHYIISQPNSVLSMFIFSSDLIEKIVQEKSLKSPVLTHNYQIMSAFDQIWAELKEKPPYYFLEVNSAIVRLMVAIFRGEDICPCKKTSDLATGRYKELLVEVDQKYAYYTSADAARFMGQSAQYFSTFFHRMAGVTFTRYLNEVRIENAIELLKNSPEMSITEVAVRCGFETIRNFNRVFKNVLGFSPKQIPKDYILVNKQMAVTKSAFDPTLDETELLST